MCDTHVIIFNIFDYHVFCIIIKINETRFRCWDDFEERVESHGSNWDDDITLYHNYDWDELGREIYEVCYGEITDILDNYFDFEAYGKSLEFDGFEEVTNGIIEIRY